MRKPLTPEQRERKRELDRAYYVANRETYKKKAREWYRANPERAAAARADWYRRHQDKVREYYKVWATANREHLNAYIAGWLRAHPDVRYKHYAARRAWMRDAFREMVDRRDVLRRHNGICGWCRQPVDPTNFHVDHIVALVHGGEHSYANTQPTHPKCNIAKRVALKERAA